MFDLEKMLLKKLCLKSNGARQAALSNELQDRGVRFENWNDMALVVPSFFEMEICSTLDNNFGLLNFEMIGKVSAEVKNAVNLMAA